MIDPPRKLTAADLQELLRDPLERLAIKTPGIKTCQELVIWTGMGPIDDIKRTQHISDKPHRYMTSFLSSLNEVDSYWNAVLQHTLQAASNRGSEALIKEGFEKEVTEPLRRLRDAFTACEHLIEETPKDFDDDWGLTARGLHAVFLRVVALSGSNTRSGLSKDGPAVSFVMAGLRTMGWDRPTADAVLQFLKRTNKGISHREW